MEAEVLVGGRKAQVMNLEKAVSLALDMHIAGLDENDIREMDLDGEYSEKDLTAAFEVRMVFRSCSKR